LVFRYCAEGKIEKVLSDRKIFLTSAEFFDQFYGRKRGLIIFWLSYVLTVLKKGNLIIKLVFCILLCG
jgi:hypothetical protein